VTRWVAYEIPAPPRVELSLPIGHVLRPSQLVALAQAADGAGRDADSCGGLVSSDAFALLGAIATSMDRIRIETDVVSTLTRSPALLAIASGKAVVRARGVLEVGVLRVA
jgi:alkanesulfonate monooxygenase SsuD/methylene tetrahydromethanopterin reductase-like flavin-dependent oxidoreductase (luciferase family)